MRKEEQQTIPFHEDWFYSSRSRTDLSTVIHSLDEDHRHSLWKPVQLPHFINVAESSSLHSERHHWYYKTFQWDKTSKESDQRVALIFDSAVDNITIWFNSVEIFSQVSPIDSVTIDLTEYLSYTNNYEQCNDENILYIRSRYHSLSTTAHLIITQPKASLIKSDSNDQSIQLRSLTMPIRKYRVLDYLVFFNQSDGRFTIHSNFDGESTDKSPSSLDLPSIVVDSADERLYETISDDKSRIRANEIQVPRLTIVMLIVGTRGDVQPFLAFGKTLRSAGHRVRLATHERFRSSVRQQGLEFYPIASNPDDLMSFMVKNGGVFPTFSSILEGDLKKKRRDIAAILQSTWRACIESDDETGAPFLAEVIIANPPSFGHIHCAQKLQIPLHIMFTMPWSPTTAFPHAFCKIDYSKSSREKLNLLSYSFIEGLTWSGTADVVNDFRREVLNLPPFHNRQGMRALTDEHIPHTYCWSPSLVPRPDDWPPHIDVAGYFFLDHDPNEYQPPKELVEFLHMDGDHPPMYIGFGSITGHDSHHLLHTVLGALEKTGYRAVLSGFDKEDIVYPPTIYKTNDVPHDWLFQHVSAVCHHGGAGTTAAGLRAGRPTIIVPFFGDQFFWASVVEKIGAGPVSVNGKSITVDELAEAFRMAHQPEIKEAAERVQQILEKEDGCSTALRIFHSQLPVSRIRSDLEQTFAACYRVDDFDLQVSRPVAQVLIATGTLDESQFRRYATREWKSIYDHRIHLPASGALKHTQKAISYMFLRPPGDMRRALSSGSLVSGVFHGVGEVCKDVGKGIAHLSVGATSLYGELTDVLDRVPSLYDRYEELDRHERPCVIDMRSGARAASHSLIYGWKDGITGITRKPRIGYRRHGIVGGATGVCIGTANGFLKPTVGSLASVTWLGRGAYASIKKKRRRKTSYKFEEHAVLNKLPSRPSFLSYEDHLEYDADDDMDDAIPNSIKFASMVSGYPPDLCQHILDEFEKVKQHREALVASIPAPSDHHHHHHRRRHRSCFSRQRRHSDSAI